MDTRKVAVTLVIAGLALVALSVTVMRVRVVQCDAEGSDAIHRCVTHNVGLLDGAMGPDTIVAGLGGGSLVAGLAILLVPNLLSARRSDNERAALEARRAQRQREPLRSQ
jgi:hypothetical protein